MKLLIITQSVDKNNHVLGFFHHWVAKFASKFEKITVIALGVGEYDLPENVSILSLGKEKGRSRIKYLWNFYKYIWAERKNYDAVFVHMNQEYVLLGAKHWWFMGKPIYMWKNHHVGSFLTDIAALFCKKVFCTSKYSHTAKYKKTVIMPVGVDTEIFKFMPEIHRIPKSILFLGRIAPVKKPDLLVDALLEMKDVDWSVAIVGDPSPKDVVYYESIKAKAVGNRKIVFKKGIPNVETPKIYSANEIFVNLSSSGMYDKTIIEAMACGCLVLASNENLRGHISDDFLFEERSVKALETKLQKLLYYSDGEKDIARRRLCDFAENHSLTALSEKLYNEISNK